jgi:hypothetical protein
MCDNCALLEKRIEQLRLENIDLEERRSRERTRFLTEQQENFMLALDGDSVPKKDFMDLLDLLERVTSDPGSETLEAVRAQLEKYVV